MKASTIFHKTAKGLAEIETRSGLLSLKQRRVLILVNGDNDVATLRQLSLCENVTDILDRLVSHGFAEQDEPAETASADVTSRGGRPGGDVGAREFMCNTLLTFANRVRVGKLIEEIDAVTNIENLREMVSPWYQAISETPGGMYQADDLKTQVMNMIEDEEIGGSASR